MRFVKMHGLGNDYIFLNCMEHIPDNLGELARRLSDRHFGVGGDGIICICPSKRADFRMRMFNADGSEGAMCGNGIRCLGKYVYEMRLTDQTCLSIETLSGERGLTLKVEAGTVKEVEVDMGEPSVFPSIEVSIKGKYYTATPVSMGNPHAVIPVADPNEIDLWAEGPELERHPAFSQRVNVEFVRVRSPGELEMRVWERGSGETLACGTGACAAVAAMASAGMLNREAVVHLAGGDLRIRWEEKSGHMFMTGPAVVVFDGKLAD